MLPLTLTLTLTIQLMRLSLQSDGALNRMLKWHSCRCSVIGLEGQRNGSIRLARQALCKPAATTSRSAIILLTGASCDFQMILLITELFVINFFKRNLFLAYLEAVSWHDDQLDLYGVSLCPFVARPLACLVIGDCYGLRHDSGVY
jgi:hypothetical protein